VSFVPQNPANALIQLQNQLAQQQLILLDSSCHLFIKVSLLNVVIHPPEVRPQSHRDDHCKHRNGNFPEKNITVIYCIEIQLEIHPKVTSEQSQRKADDGHYSEPPHDFISL